MHRLFDAMRAGDSAAVRAVFHPDGRLITAAMWAAYAFFVGTKFSHCGGDAFLLAKVGAEWRIVALADTRRRDGGPEAPPAAP